ncbi:MAG: methyltransferase [Dehalococcoidia bacterium]|nr:methyltransferase [Dehalococcoidia bacterium]MDH4367278.1 methyltransferase [Dehalococcoidia bacterium]
MSQKKSASPSLDIVYALEYGVWKATALYAALELDVFTIIANDNHTGDAIVSEARCDRRGMRILLDALCSLKLLLKQKGNYFLTPVSESFLIRGKPAYYGEWCLRTQLAFDIRSRVADGIKAGRVAAIDASRPGSGDLWKSDISRALYTWPLEAKQARRMWRTLGITRRRKNSPRILDIACGSGVNSFVLAQADPGARVTAFDFPDVLEVTCQVAEVMGVVEQVDFQSGDVLTSDFGTDCFDIVLLGKILYYFDVDHAARILRRVHSALKRDGLIVISTYIGDNRSCRDERALMAALQLFIFAPESHVYTFSEYRDLLKRAGFKGVVRHTETLITGTK